MSIMRCPECDRMVDTDEDVDFFDNGEMCQNCHARGGDDGTETERRLDWRDRVEAVRTLSWP